MNQSSRVLPIIIAFVGLNATLVAWSIVDRYSVASQQVADSSSNTSGGTDDTKSASPRAANEAATLASDSLPQSDVQKLLDSIPAPDPSQLPTMEPPADLESDAGFRSFREQAAEIFPLSDDSLLADTDIDKPILDSGLTKKTEVEQNYDRIVERLKIVSRLNEAAMGLAQEAGQLSHAGQKELAAELLAKTNQLRQMAAELLVPKP